MSECVIEVGIIKKWNGIFGIVSCPGGKKYFLHKAHIVSGHPEDGARASLTVGPQRSAADLPLALKVEILGLVVTPSAGGSR